MIAALIIRGLFSLAFAQNAIAISPAQQQTPLKQHDTISMLASDRQRVPGDNPEVYFCGSTPEEQLFDITELTVAPNPIPMDHRFFGYLNGYLNGYLPDQPLPGLEHAIFKLNITKDDEEPREYVGEISHWSQIILRQKGIYSHELQPGMNEILADYFFLAFLIHAGWYTFTGELNLPDGRLLFCIKATMYLAGKA